jgi:recombinational DNA repair protein RecR
MDINSLSDKIVAEISEAFDNMGITDVDKASKRISICNNCSNYLTATKQCKLCGCFVPIKARLKSAVCPNNLW